MIQSHVQSDYPGRWWMTLPDGRIECRLCPRFCKLNEGQRGFCFVRQRVGDEMALTTYGRSSGFCVDPIEKKPLNHFLPGTSVLSFGTAGCNLGCRFCRVALVATLFPVASRTCQVMGGAAYADQAGGGVFDGGHRIASRRHVTYRKHHLRKRS